MKALTVWRPWSDAIVRGPKRVENRVWAPPGRLLGHYIAVHAGKRYDEDCWPMPGFEPPEPDDSPTGIVGVARLLGVLEVRGKKKRMHQALQASGPFWPGMPPDAAGELGRRLWMLDQDPWWAGPCGWLLGEVRAIDPIPCRGAQGLWAVPPDEYALLRRRWKEAAPSEERI